MNLKQSIVDDLCILAKRYDLQELILFGSRATGKCTDRSDIDLAAYFKKRQDYFSFCEDVENIHTLLMFDVVNLSSDMISLDLRKSIEEEGVPIYEKV